MSENIYHSYQEAGLPGSPLILALHGTGGDEHQFTGLVRNILPDAGLVAPRGDVLENGANRFFRRTGEGVYDMKDLAYRTDRMLSFVEGVRADHPGRPLYAFGYSNGANILAAMLFKRPKLFDRAALLHPLIPWVPDPQPGLAGMPVLIGIGLNDPISPLPLSRRLIDWFIAQGAKVEVETASQGHQLHQAEINGLARLLRADTAAETRT
ncbi:alpha/beta hydrolase [Paracoccus pacificus]|uniref:Alpha/beta hydrolase n=1 Tax=Paracoccus pacificus TaxID=1463598 RepID=A0ABW4R5F1_9RHOB